MGAWTSAGGGEPWRHGHHGMEKEAVQPETLIAEAAVQTTETVQRTVTMAVSAISIDMTRFDYCPRMKVKALRLPCGEREECAGCERSPEFLKYQQKQKRKQEQDEKRRNHLGRLEEKTCEFCGKKFMGIKKRRFCSYACSSHGKHHTRSEKVCLVCGMTFMGTKQQIYCSRVCKDRSHYKRLGGDE